MKTLKLNIIKKNRVYFKCLNEKGYEVKLKITPKSADLTLGEHDLYVHDISVVSKYGTDFIYELEEEVKDEGVVTLKHFTYNQDLVEECKKLGGKWDASNKTWVFPKFIEEKVEELDFLYNSDIVNVEAECIGHDVYQWRGALRIMGYAIAQAWGRDSGASVCEGISMISGSVTSGGSVKNWTTFVEKGTKFRFKMSRNLVNTFKEDNDWKLTILD